MKRAEVYSILVDDCKDCSKTEQLSFVLRYVDVGTGDICESFLTFVATSCQDAQSLSKYILDTLDNHGLDSSRIVSQGYDGASVMSGRYTGVQQRIKDVVPHAIYVHCYAHTLNLVLVDAVKSVQLAVEFFVHLFMSSFQLLKLTQSFLSINNGTIQMHRDYNVYLTHAGHVGFPLLTWYAVDMTVF